MAFPLQFSEVDDVKTAPGARITLIEHVFSRADLDALIQGFPRIVNELHSMAKVPGAAACSQEALDYFEQHKSLLPSEGQLRHMKDLLYSASKAGSVAREDLVLVLLIGKIRAMHQLLRKIGYAKPYKDMNLLALAEGGIAQLLASSEIHFAPQTVILARGICGILERALPDLNSDIVKKPPSLFARVRGTFASFMQDSGSAPAPHAVHQVQALRA